MSEPAGSDERRFLRAPWPTGGDPRLALLAHFPAPLAFGTALALRAGLDVENPVWRAVYRETARVAP